MNKITIILIIGLLIINNAQGQTQQGSLRQRVLQQGNMRQKVQQQKQKGIDYDQFVNKTNEEYEAFRDSVNSEYAAFMEKVWKNYSIQEGEQKPIEKEVKPIEYDQKKDELYLQERIRLEEERKLAEEKQKQEQQQKQLAEEKQKQEELQKQLVEEKQKQEEQQKQLDDERHKQEEQQKQITEERQKQEEQQKQLNDQRQKLEEQLKQIAQEKLKQEQQHRLLAELKQQQEQEQLRLDEEKKKLQEQQQQIAEQIQKQKEQQKILENQNKQDELKNLFEEQKHKEEELRLIKEKQKQQQEQEKLFAEKQKQQKEKECELAEQQKKQQEQELLLIKQQKMQQEQEQLLAEKQKQQEELQRKLEEQQRQQQELQQKLEQLQKQQKEQKNQLAEKKMQQEEQERLLAEQKKKQDEKEHQLAEQKKKLEQERSKPLEAVVVPIKEDKKEQPKPVVPIPENDKVFATNNFEYYGTPMGVRWGNIKQFKLKGTTPKDFANGYRELSKSEYNNLIHDCLKLRKEYELCDWAYYKMLQTLSEDACGKGTNEAVFLQGYIFNQSGYQMRFAKEAETNKLHLLTRINGMPYNCGYTSVEGRIFFIMDGSKAKNLEICEASAPKAQEMSLAMNTLPILKKDLSENRTVISRFVSVEAQTSVNKNMINFFNDYPTSYDGNDMMSRWAYYANTPITPEVREKVYPQLQKYVKNVSKLAGANLLLNWVQMGLQYAYDEKVWGQDRAFFAEESLYYPFCDCEDRSILFSHLMRDLLDLDVVLVYYPGHLYTAVCFNEHVEGDYIMVNGKKFVVADPTYYNANVGKTMSRMDNSKAKVIILKR